MKKTSLMLVSFALSALPAAPQTPTTGYQPAQPQTVTLSGCVASVNSSPSVFTLSNPVIVPTSPQPGTVTNVPAPAPIGTTAAQPPPTPAQPPATPPAVTPATPPVNVPAIPPVTTPATPPSAVPPMPPATTPPPPPNPATSGVTAAPPAATGINTAPPTAGINTAGQAAANTGGFLLSGVSMSPFSGQRVQVVGVMVPQTSPGAATAVGTTGTTGAPMQEFRVQSVQPISGNCPPQ